jgi:hypothetical protein
MPRRKDIAVAMFLALLIVHAIRSGGGSIVAPSKVTAAVYVFEQRDGGIQSELRGALDKLNRASITATEFDVSGTDGKGELPDQYKTAVPAAKEHGLPSFVVLAGDKVLNVVKAPKTEAEMLTAAGVKP